MLRIASSYCLLFFLLFPFQSIGQDNDPLKTRITVENSTRTIKEFLAGIESQYDIRFSYSTKKIDVENEVTVNAGTYSLVDFLNLLFNDSANYTIVERQIVIAPQKGSVENNQNVTLSGVMTDQETGELMIGATLWFPELLVGTASNAYGFYSITVPKGNYQVKASFIGYQPKVIDLNLEVSRNLDIELERSIEYLPEITIEATQFTVKENMEQKGINLQSQFIREIPSLMSEPDVLKAIQMVPGINLQSDVSTFYFVRGGSRDQNIILLDEAPIYNPSHMLGLFSTISPETVKSLTLYKGDAPLSMGGFTSSYANIQTNDGNKKRLKLSGDVGLIAARLSVEGPLKKDKSSFFLAGRTSHIKWFFRQQNPAIDNFNFYDLTGKLNIAIRKKHRLFLTVYGGRDFYSESGSQNIQWTNSALTLRWNYLISDKWFANSTFTASTYDYLLSTNSSANQFWNSKISDAGVKFDLTHFKNPGNSWDFGLSVKWYQFNPGNLVDNNRNNIATFLSEKFANEFVLYGQNDRTFWDKLNLVYGLRMVSWTNIGESFEISYDDQGTPIDTATYSSGEAFNNYTTLEPRVRLSYPLNNGVTLNTGYRRNVQNLHLISNSISPFTNLDVWLPSNLTIEPQTSSHIFMGASYLNKKKILFMGELYYKRVDNEIGYQPHARMIFNPFLEGQLLFGKSSSYGLELTALKEIGRFRAMGGYVISRAEKQFDNLNNGVIFPAFSDTPHQLKFNVQYDISPRITLASNWTYHTGFAITTPSGFYQYDDQTVPYYNSINNDRLPDYHRLDLAGRFTLNKNENKKFSHYLEINLYNLYGRKNPYYVNFNKQLFGDGEVRVPGDLLNKSLVPTHTFLFQFVPSISYHFSVTGK